MRELRDYEVAAMDPFEYRDYIENIVLSAAEEEKTMDTMRESMKEWHNRTYPDDETDMIGYYTFEDLFSALDTYKDIYAEFGIEDSVVRERLFSRIAELLEVEYDYIYEQWLRG